MSVIVEVPLEESEFVYKYQDLIVWGHKKMLMLVRTRV